VQLRLTQCACLQSTSCSTCREGLLGGAHADRNRRFRLQPYEIVPLLLSFLVSALNDLRFASPNLLLDTTEQRALLHQVAALANACGVGGGAFFVPMFNVLLGFSKLKTKATQLEVLHSLLGRSSRMHQIS